MAITPRMFLFCGALGSAPRYPAPWSLHPAQWGSPPQTPDARLTPDPGPRAGLSLSPWTHTQNTIQQ